MPIETKSAIITLVLFVFSFSQEVALRGRVIDTAFAPVEGVIIQLKNIGIADTTGPNGSFKLFEGETVSELKTNLSFPEIEIKGGMLHFQVSSFEEEISIYLNDITGRKIATLINGKFNGGRYSVSMTDYMKNKLPSALYVLSIIRNKIATHYKMFLIEGEAIIVSPVTTNNHRNRILKKTLAVSDTLLVMRDNVLYSRIPVSNLIDSLADIQLILLPTYSFLKINEFPNYCQLDTAYGGLVGGGTAECGPTAVSNGIIWLSNNGFPNLTPRTIDRKKDQFDVIWEIGDDPYMHYRDPWGFTNGLRQFITDKGYDYDTLLYHGPGLVWRIHRGDSLPTIKTIKEGIQDKNIECWLFWICSYNASTDRYSNIVGHWVTFVGYGHDGSIENPDYYILHDPYHPEADHFYTKLEKIETGTISAESSIYPAAGHYKANYLAGRTNIWILRGVVVLKMPGE